MARGRAPGPSCYGGRRPRPRSVGTYQFLRRRTATTRSRATAAATVSVTSAARMLGVHPNTVRAWTDAGRLDCLRINARGDRRYRVTDLRAFLTAARGAGAPRRERGPVWQHGRGSARPA